MTWKKWRKKRQRQREVLNQRKGESKIKWERTKKERVKLDKKLER